MFKSLFLSFDFRTIASVVFLSSDLCVISEYLCCCWMGVIFSNNVLNDFTGAVAYS